MTLAEFGVAGFHLCTLRCWGLRPQARQISASTADKSFCALDKSEVLLCSGVLTWSDCAGEKAPIQKLSPFQVGEVSVCSAGRVDYNDVVRHPRQHECDVKQAGHRQALHANIATELMSDRLGGPDLGSTWARQFDIHG